MAHKVSHFNLHICEYLIFISSLFSVSLDCAPAFSPTSHFFHFNVVSFPKVSFDDWAMNLLNLLLTTYLSSSLDHLRLWVDFALLSKAVICNLVLIVPINVSAYHCFIFPNEITFLCSHHNNLLEIKIQYLIFILNCIF